MGRLRTTSQNGQITRRSMRKKRLSGGSDESGEQRLPFASVSLAGVHNKLKELMLRRFEPNAQIQKRGAAPTFASCPS